MVQWLKHLPGRQASGGEVDPQYQKKKCQGKMMYLTGLLWEPNEDMRIEGSFLLLSEKSRARVWGQVPFCTAPSRNAPGDEESGTGNQEMGTGVCVPSEELSIFFQSEERTGLSGKC